MTDMAIQNYQVLDVAFSLESSVASFQAAFHQDYHRFALPGPGTAPAHVVRFEEEGGAPFLEVDGRRETLEGHPFPAFHAAQALAQMLMDWVSGFTILHAATLGIQGGALAIAGPSGAGKTTLALGLLESGLTYLSDDFCPLHRKTELVHPFPRSLWVRPAPGQASTHQHRGKLLFPLDERAFPIGREPLPLKWCICLDAGGPEQMGKLAVTLREGRETLFLEGLHRAGAEIRRRGAECRIGYPRAGGCGRQIKALLQQHREAYWSVFSLPASQPDFSREATLTRIQPHEAAFFLLRELKHSLLDGTRPQALKPGTLLGHLACLLREVNCFRLTPGSRERRLNLVREALEQEATA